MYWLAPRCFQPGFTWREHRRRLAKQMPDLPQPTPLFVRRLWGLLHVMLRLFSVHYCKWFGIDYNKNIIQLPFGVVIKWSDGIRIEEVLAMQTARMAGFPVPHVLCYGEHPNTPHAPISILMTRVSGDELGRVYGLLSDRERRWISSALQCYLGKMRQWVSPYGPRICSLTGAAIKSARIPDRVIGPFESEQDFNQCLLQPSWRGRFDSEAVFERTLNTARSMDILPHKILFSHGDLKHSSIMVKGGRITGLLDWGSAGWYPEYWEFTTALRSAPKGFWWYDLIVELGGGSYLAELKCERALNSLTSKSFTGSSA